MPDISNYMGLFRPHFTSPEQRRFVTVARAPLLKDALATLRNGVSRKSKNHFLFIGPRGIGKTHLLSLIEDEIQRDPELSQRYVVARFPEESHRILTFADFLLGLCEILQDRLPDEPLWRTLYESLHTEEDDTRIEAALTDAIRRENRGRKRTIIVMLENLHETLSHQIKSPKDVAAIRKFFMGNNGCQLIATAPLHFEAITDVGQPFYDFFDTQILDSLAEAESLDLIHKKLEWDKRNDLLANFKELAPKVSALYRMTGGNPRLVVMLSELIAHDSVATVQQQFQILLDRVTPFYQSRLSDLPPQERALLETMACMRDQEKTPASIAERMRLSQPQVSSLLKRLSEAQYVRSETHPDDKRSKLYTIREGFFDIWLAMNLSRGSRKRLPFLLDFFSIFYPSHQERERKRQELREKIASDPTNPDKEQTLDYLSEVGSEEEKVAAKGHLAQHHARKGDAELVRGYVREIASIAGEDFGRWILRSSEEATSLDYLTEVQEMVDCWEKHRSGNLEAFVAKIRELGKSLTYKSYSDAKVEFLLEYLGEISPEDQIRQRIRIAGLMHELARWSEAEKLLREALSFVEDIGNPKLHSLVLNNLAQMLKATNRLAEAEPMMRQALAIDEGSFGSDHPRIAIRLNNLAVLLKATNRLGEAEPMMRKALAIDEVSFGNDHPKVAIRLNNLAQLLEVSEAEPMMRRALAIDEASYGGDHPNIAIRLNNLAQLLKATNRLTEAEPMMRKALAIDEASFGNDHPKVAIRLNNLAQLLEVSEAEPMMRRALAIDEASYGGDHPKVAIDLNNLASLLKATGRLEEAEALSWRHILIFLRFGKVTGHEHPYLQDALRNYTRILQAMGLSLADAAASIQAKLRLPLPEK